MSDFTPEVDRPIGDAALQRRARRRTSFPKRNRMPGRSPAEPAGWALLDVRHARRSFVGRPADVAARFLEQSPTACGRLSRASGLAITGRMRVFAPARIGRTRGTAPCERRLFPWTAAAPIRCAGHPSRFSGA